eukprot:CAMPEP_0201739826 /NCGR_PEP_ID=MMETSP0593-20130828/45989_1 /ASSEMBLY_ACC=CAM_ASM_000672 /TAXON_ID=267983 /ORGANISM="Skeletonema japonicum, Strain CCMP2506" /LENGTH=259 /DNA_ID=CAMNT_0048234119 /DNA_START=130 /DNA_END=905 /DNA_ORIENTATION=-
MYSASRCAVLSNSRRSVTNERTRSSYTTKQTRSYHHASSSSAKRSYRSCGVFAAAGTSCAMCHSVRLTSVCSTSSMLQYRGMQTTSSSTNTSSATFTAGSTVNNRYYSKSYRSCGVFAAAGTSCAMCHSVRLTSVCSTSSMLQYRGMQTTTSSTTTFTAGSTVNNRYYSKSPPCFGNGLGRSSAAPISNSTSNPLVPCANQLISKANSANVSSSQIGAFHSSSRVSSAPLVIGGKQSMIEQLGNVEEIIASGSWASRAG